MAYDQIKVKKLLLWFNLFLLLIDLREMFILSLQAFLTKTLIYLPSPSALVKCPATPSAGTSRFQGHAGAIKRSGNLHTHPQLPPTRVQRGHVIYASCRCGSLSVHALGSL